METVKEKVNLSTQIERDRLDGNCCTKPILSSKIYLIESVFGSYNRTEIYYDKDKRSEILNFGVDNQKRRLLILTGIKN